MDFLQEALDLFKENTKEIYVIGSTMRLHLSELGYCTPPDHVPNDIDLLIVVKDVNKAIKQFKACKVNPKFHIGFNDKLFLQDITHLQIYPEKKVNIASKNPRKALFSIVKLFFTVFLPKNPFQVFRQLWVLRSQIQKC